jgi:hypothetical protein
MPMPTRSGAALRGARAIVLGERVLHGERGGPRR